MGVGGGKSKEKSQPDFFLVSHFCPSQCQKQSRPDLDVPHLGVTEEMTVPGMAGSQNYGLQP